MTSSRPPSKRKNDGLSMRFEKNVPLGRTLRRMAELVLHARPEVKPLKRQGTIGSKHPAKRKFTEAEVIALRLRYSAGEWPSKLAQEFGINKFVMRAILTGRNYSWIK